MAVLGSNSLNHSADLLVQRAGTTRITVTSTGLTLGGDVVLSTEGTATNQAVRADRSISTGDGLSGGGNLTINRTFTVDSTVVRTSGNQTIAGTKTFPSTVAFTNVNQLLLKNGTASNVTTIFRNDGADQYILLSNASTAPNGSWNTLRPFQINLTTGLLSSANSQSFSGTTTVNGTLVLGNAGTATNHAVRADRTISTGSGLSGGGNLTANRTFSVDSTVLRTSGQQQITKNAHASGASDYHLELFSPNINGANEVSLRMHQANQWFGQIRLRSDGFHFTQGGDNSYRNIFFGTATGALSGNATTATLANNINRTGTTAATNAFYRVLLGNANNNTGSSPAFVVNNASRLYYNPSTDTLTVGTLSGTATNCSRQIINGNGMNFTGGALNTDRTITLGTPGTCTGATTNSVTTSSHTHAITVNLGVTAGTTAGPTITSSAGTNAVIPTASATASGAVTTGNQTWAGTKTFNAGISVPQNNNNTGGGVNFNGAQSAFIRGRNQDGASNTSSNLQLQSWFGIGFGPTISGQPVPIGENAIWMNVRNGDFSFRGTLQQGTVPWARLSGVPSSLSNTVNLSGNQTIDGTKTFTARPTANKYLSSITGSVAADGFIHASNSQLGMTGDVNGRVMRLYGLNASNTRVEFAFLRNDGTGGCSLPGSGASTTSSAANCRISSGGFIQRSTSSAIYKKDIEPAILEISENIIYNSEPVWYRSTCKSDNCDWSWWGFIAEQIAEVDPRMVGWDYRLSDLYVNDERCTVPKEGAEKQPEGVNYDRYVVHLVNVAQKQKELIDNLIERISDLENLIK
jgi:hypothetical protein